MGRLAQVRNQTGDTLKFNYSTKSYHLPKIEVVSKSGVSQYFLDKNQNLAQVISATGERTGYQYKDKDIHNLTAKLIYDDNNQRTFINIEHCRHLNGGSWVVVE